MGGLAIVGLAAIAISLLWALRHSTSSSNSAPLIAVTPFSTGSLTGVDEYLARGFADEIANHLSRVGTLRVLSPASSAALAKNRTDFPRQAMGLAATLAGGIERSGAEWKIGSKLVAVDRGRVLWSETFKTDNAGLSTVEQTIVSRVMDALDVPAPRPELAPRNAEAFELYLRGRRVVRDRQAPDLSRGIELIRRAIEKDPQFALAYAALAGVYAVEVANGVVPPETLRFGEAAAQRALALDPSLADAHASLGLLKYCRWDWQGAEVEYATALRLNPNSAVALMRSALVSFAIGRFTEAESRLQQAQLLDPYSGSITGMLGELYYYWCRYEDAIRQAERIKEFDPANFVFAWELESRALRREGRMREYKFAVKKELELSRPAGNLNSQLLSAWVDCDMDRAKFSRRLNEIAGTTHGQYISPLSLAYWYASQDDKDSVFRWLETAYQQHITDLVSVQWDPAFDSIRGDPRYAKLLAHMGLSRVSYR